MSGRARLFAGLLGAAALLGACTGDDPTRPEAEGVVVRFAFEGFPDTMRVAITDAATIEAAKQFVATGDGPRIPNGMIVRGAGVDPRYPFHYLPETVRLADLTMEVCDGAPMRTPAEVDDFFELGGDRGAKQARWCPWAAYPVAVEEG